MWGQENDRVLLTGPIWLLAMKRGHSIGAAGSHEVRYGGPTRTRTEDQLIMSQPL